MNGIIYLLVLYDTATDRQLNYWSFSALDPFLLALDVSSTSQQCEQECVSMCACACVCAHVNLLAIK